MARPDSKDQILEDGMRYKSKVSGSPFLGKNNFGPGMMSCLLCGTHRARSAMMMRKFAGKLQNVCGPSCKAAREADAVLAQGC